MVKKGGTHIINDLKMIETIVNEFLVDDTEVIEKITFSFLSHSTFYLHKYILSDKYQ